MEKGMFHCEQCNVSMTGHEQHAMHMAGKKHLKKLKSLGLSTASIPKKSAEVTPAGQGNGTTQPSGQFDSAAAAGQTNKTAAPNTGQFGKPTVPQSQQFGRPAGTNIVQPTKQFVKASTERLVGGEVKNAPAYVDPSESWAQGNSDPVMNAVKANLLGKLPLKRQAYEGRCDVCNVQYTSESHEGQHLSGQKHAKKVKLAEAGIAGATVPSATFFCSFCNVKVNSQAQLDQHREGAIHKKKEEFAQKKQNQQGGGLGGPSPAKKQFVPSSV